MIMTWIVTATAKEIKEVEKKSSKRQMIISFTVLSHHRTYGSVYDSTMTSADFSLFVVTAVSLMRPHGISSNTFIVYL